MSTESGPRQTRGYIDVDSLQRELNAQGDVVERVARFYGSQLSPLHQIGQETRLACPFDCGKTESTGDRAISVKTDGDVPVWRCFHYGCTVRGNILTLMHWLKHDRGPSGDRLQGAEFQEMARDLRAIVGGQAQISESEPKPIEQAGNAIATEPVFNIPLKDSENERARDLVNLDDQFITDVAEMSPQAAAYVRKRTFMTPQTMKKFRCGYLPSSAKGLLRGHFVYGYPDAEGNILTWFGRNLRYEEQYRKWKRVGDSSKEPAKFKFVKGFHRGQELYGLPQFEEISTPEQIQRTGIVLVEGPNDVINLHSLGVPALGICSNTITVAQAELLVVMANSVPGGHVSVMFDLDQEGEKGAKQVVLELAKHCCVKLAWTSDAESGQFKGRQPESLTRKECETSLHTHYD